MNPSRVLAVAFVLLGTVLTSCNATVNTLADVCSRLGLTYMNSSQTCVFSPNSTAVPSYVGRFQLCSSLLSASYRGRMAQITTPAHLNIASGMTGGLFFVGAHSLVNGTNKTSEWAWLNEPYGQPVAPLNTSVANISFTGGDCMTFCTKVSTSYCGNLQLASASCSMGNWPLCELYTVPKTIPQFKRYATGKWLNQTTFASTMVYNVATTWVMASVPQTSFANVSMVQQCLIKCNLQNCASFSYKQTTKQCILHDMPASWLDQKERRLVNDPNAEIWSYTP